MNTPAQTFNPKATTPLSYGLRQERAFRHGLTLGGGLRVHYSEELDRIYKLDAVALDAQSPGLPAVGIQFSTNPDAEKVARTIAAVRRSCVVQRFLYVEARCSLGEAAYPILIDLVRITARMPAERAVVFAALDRDETTGFFLRRLRAVPMDDAAKVAKSPQPTPSNSKRAWAKVAMIAAVMLLTLTISRPAAAVPAGAGVSFRVERGDTYTSLFGHDWQKAFAQNRIVVVRDGKLVCSPDILVEGAVISVSADVRLTPQAQSRCAEIEQAREHLIARLARVEHALGSSDPDVQACKRLLSGSAQYVASAEFAAERIALLENRSTQHSDPVALLVEPAGDRLSALVSASLTGALIALLWVLWYRRRRMSWSGAVRYQAARDRFETILRGVGNDY